MPQKAWSEKDERQYQKVKKSEKERGLPEERASEIAARTVNKQRQQEGRTDQEHSSGTGNPRTSLDSRTRDELYNRAKEMKIKGRGSMSKTELVEAIREQEGNA